jgi:hypothetical protein
MFWRICKKCLIRVDSHMSHFPCTKHFLQILQNLKINFDDLRRFAMRYKNVSKTSYRNNVPIILQAGLFRRSEFDHFHIKAKTAYISRVPQNKNEYLRKFNCAPRAVRYKLFTCQIKRHFSNVFPRVRYLGGVSVQSWKTTTSTVFNILGKFLQWVPWAFFALKENLIVERNFMVDVTWCYLLHPNVRWIDFNSKEGAANALFRNAIVFNEIDIL